MNNRANGTIMIPPVCTLGMMIYPLPMQAHQQDMQTYDSLCKYVERFFLIVWSPDAKAHVQHYRRIIGLYVPQQHSQALSHLSFVPLAVRMGWLIHKQYGVRLFQASEPIGGGLAGAILKRVTGGKLLLHMQGQFFNLPPASFNHFKSWLMRTIARMSCKNADLIRSISSTVAQECVRHGIPESKLHVVRSRCDTLWFSRERWEDASQALRKSLGLDGKKVIVTIGSLVPSKGLSYLLEAMPPIVKRFPNLIWIIVGDGPLRSKLLERAIELDVESHIIFVGRIPFNSIPVYLSAADVFLMPSVDEGLGRALMEAMALEKPVIGSRVGGIPELIDDGINGILVSPADSEALVEALGRLLTDSRLGQEIGRLARQKIVEHYNYEKGIKQYADLLGKLATMDQEAVVTVRQAGG